MSLKIIIFVKTKHMKKSFLFIFVVLTCNFVVGQTKPVQNLVWYHTHIFPYNNIFSLSWQEPDMPHNELVGYNIYRENELYRFQTKTSLGCDSRYGVNDGCDFLTKAFTGFVAAVYEGGEESEYISFQVGGPALSVNDVLYKPISIFPNPVKDILNLSEEVSNVRIVDISGKVVKQISTSEKSINISKLTKGNYIMTATTKTGETIKKKFIKE